MPSHDLVNGICTTCTEQQRGKHSLDDEPRDPHSGKWIIGAGGIEAAGKHALELADEHHTVSTAHGPFTAVAAEPGRVHASWPASSGKPPTMDLTFGEANNIAHAINEIGAKVDAYLGGDATATKKIGREKVKVGSSSLVIFGTAKPDIGNGDATFEGDGWTLELPLDDAEFILGKLSNAASEAEALTQEDVADRSFRPDRHVLVNGECITCRPTVARHQLVDGVCTCGCEPLDEDSAALLVALTELGGMRRSWTAAESALHPHNPKGPGGGRFRSNVDKLKHSIAEHKAGRGTGSHPFDDFNREQLRRVAVAHGIPLKRGEDRDSIAKKLLDHLDTAEKVEPAVAPARKTAAPRPIARPLGDKTLKKLTAEQVDNSIEMHGTETPRGKQLVEEKRRRAGAVPLPGKAAPKPIEAPKGRASGSDISGSVDYKALPATYNPKTGENDALKAVIAKQGFDGPARVVSASDFDAEVKNGNVRETWRGLAGSVRAGKPADLAEQYRTGDFHVGLGINGDGTYVAMNKVDGQHYGSTLLRIGLHKDAKVISADALDAEMDKYFAANAGRQSAEMRALDAKLVKDLATAKTARARANIRRKYRNDIDGLDPNKSIALQRDPGIFAALRGYDAIEIPKERSPDKHHEMIILNRTATIVQEA